MTAGANVTYTITLTNNGAATAQSVVVSDSLPAEFSFVSCDATNGGVCGGSGNDRTVSFPTLQSGESSTITIVATANGPAGTTISNTATVTSTTPDPNSVNNSATVTTLVQAPLPLLTIDDVSLSEGDSGTTTFTFTVSLSAPAGLGGVSFDIATLDNTATTANADYVAKSSTGQTIDAGKSTYSFDVTVKGDTLVESSETFLVIVSNVSNATVSDGQGQGTIVNDDVASVVISQLYGGGGNAGAQYTNDFIELFNRGTTTVDLSTWSVQYTSATGSGTWSVTPLSGTLQPGQYYLVQEASGGSNGIPLPAPDATGSIAMAATAGKVALFASTTATSGACPTGAADLAGYGTTANCFEGSGPAPAPSATAADFRKRGGCTDTNVNAADFFAHAPGPRNTSSFLNNCVAGALPSLSIDDVTVAEGNSGTVNAKFTVSLSTPAPSTDITFDIATQNDTATTANSDYVAKILTNQIIPAGQQTYSFTVVVNGDIAVEPGETFFVNVTNVTGATPGDGQGLGTIQNDDLPLLTITDVSLAEGDAGTKLFSFTVNLNTAAPSPVTFDIATADGAAQDGNPPGEDNDYLAQSLTSQTIQAGQHSYTLDVTVNGDSVIELNETFMVNVSNVAGAAVSDGQGVGTIQNDDSPSLTINDVSISEGDTGTTTFTFTVTSSLPAPAGGITFDIATADGTAQDDVPGTEDNDYVAKSLTTQTIPENQTTYTFDVTVNGDKLVEPDQTFFVSVTNVSGATVTDGQGQGTIVNDDIANLVISQIYPGGNNTGATYRNDFIELFNRGTTTVDFSITSYSVQYAGATAAFGGTNTKTDITSGTIAPGKYFLIQEAGGTTNGVALPTPDTIGTIAMAATGGKVALVLGLGAVATTSCPGDDASPPTNPSGNNIVDFVGYGTGANAPNCFEGTAAAAFSTSTAGGLDPDARSIIRTVSCTDTNNNLNDFSNPTTAPVARNTATTATPCP